MNTLIKITDINQKKSEYLVSNKKLIDIWLDVKNTIEYLINNMENNYINYLNITNQLNSIKDYYVENYSTRYDLFVDYYIDIDVHKNKIDCVLYKIKDNEQYFLYCLSKMYNVSNIGNCIDTFLERGVNGIIDSIKEYIDDIKSRQDLRSTLSEYHESSCYEKDFNRISMIKLLADKLSQNCSTHLERISEKYTKLS